MIPAGLAQRGEDVLSTDAQRLTRRLTFGRVLICEAVDELQRLRRDERRRGGRESRQGQGTGQGDDNQRAHGALSRGSPVTCGSSTAVVARRCMPGPLRFPTL